MRVNMNQSVLDYEGKPIMVNKTNPDGSAVVDDNRRPVMVPEVLRTYLSTALNSSTPGETLTAEDKAKIYMLTSKLYAKTEVDLTDHDRGFIRERVGRVYGPLVYGRICEALRSQPLPTEESEEATEDAKQSETAK